MGPKGTGRVRSHVDMYLEKKGQVHMTKATCSVGQTRSKRAPLSPRLKLLASCSLYGKGGGILQGACGCCLSRHDGKRGPGEEKLKSALGKQQKKGSCKGRRRPMEQQANPTKEAWVESFGATRAGPALL